MKFAAQLTPEPARLVVVGSRGFPGWVRVADQVVLPGKLRHALILDPFVTED